MKLVGYVVTLTLSIILIATVMVPVISDATTTTETFTNDGYFRMTHYDVDDTDSVVVEWTYDNNTVITVDGVEYDLTGPASSGVSAVIISDTAVLRASVAANYNIGNVGYLTDDTSIYAEVGNSGSISITFSAGSYSGSIVRNGSSTAVSGTYSDLYVPDSEGEYIMKAADASAYVLSDSPILAYGVTVVNTNLSTTAKGIGISGDIDDLEVTVWRGASGFTYTDPVANYSAVSGYVDLYALDDITFTGTVTETVDDETVTTDTAITYSYFLVPYQVTAELSQHLSDTEITLLSIIPLFLIAAVLCAVTYVVIRNRDY